MLYVTKDGNLTNTNELALMNAVGNSVLVFTSLQLWSQYCAKVNRDPESVYSVHTSLDVELWSSPPRALGDFDVLLWVESKFVSDVFYNVWVEQQTHFSSLDVDMVSKLKAAIAFNQTPPGPVNRTGRSPPSPANRTGSLFYTTEN